jgi:hypothetical protein
MDATKPTPARDRKNVATPLRCPVCDGALTNTVIRDMGGVTADIVWQMHAGECPQHGWFQTEIVSRPPREIFAVDRPFGVARRVEIDGQELYSFPTVWMFEPPKGARQRVDPFEPRFWKAQRSLRR